MTFFIEVLKLPFLLYTFSSLVNHPSQFCLPESYSNCHCPQITLVSFSIWKRTFGILDLLSVVKLLFQIFQIRIYQYFGMYYSFMSNIPDNVFQAIVMIYHLTSAKQIMFELIFLVSIKYNQTWKNTYQRKVN